MLMLLFTFSGDGDFATEMLAERCPPLWRPLMQTGRTVVP